MSNRILTLFHAASLVNLAILFTFWWYWFWPQQRNRQEWSCKRSQL